MDKTIARTPGNVVGSIVNGNMMDAQNGPKVNVPKSYTFIDR